MEKQDRKPTVRPTGVLIEDGKILLVEQSVTQSRHWSLPEGALEYGETLEHGLIREMKEETGLDVSVDGLLYIRDWIPGDGHVVHVTFLVSRKGGSLGSGRGKEFATGKIKQVKMVPLDELKTYGFSDNFCEKVKANFQDRGTYLKGLTIW
ncbi:MAG: NUDIX hydrolase [Dehalococcoidales bacterium]|nr:NUDIX hydrolase [Dehalococcoidales bacterium]